MLFRILFSLLFSFAGPENYDPDGRVMGSFGIADTCVVAYQVGSVCTVKRLSNTCCLAVVSS